MIRMGFYLPLDKFVSSCYNTIIMASATKFRKKQAQMTSMALVFTCAHVLDDGTICGEVCVEGTQFCKDHTPSSPDVPAEAPLEEIVEAMVAIESDFQNAAVLDNLAKKQFVVLDRQYETVMSPDGGVVELSTLTDETRLSLESEARNNAQAASRIRSRSIKSMEVITKIGLLAGPKSQTPHDVAARKMRALGISEETVDAYRAKHAIPTAEEDEGA